MASARGDPVSLQENAEVHRIAKDEFAVSATGRAGRGEVNPGGLCYGPSGGKMPRFSDRPSAGPDAGIDLIV